MQRWKSDFLFGSRIRLLQCSPIGLPPRKSVRVAISNFSASYISMHIAQKRGLLRRRRHDRRNHSHGRAHQHARADRQQRRARLGEQSDGRRARRQIENPTGVQRQTAGQLHGAAGLKSVAELRGKRIGGSTVGSLDYGWLKEVLPKFGLQLEKDVNFVPVGSTSSRLHGARAGSIDAASFSPPSSLIGARRGLSDFVSLRRSSGRHPSVHRRHRRSPGAPRRYDCAVSCARRLKASASTWPIARKASRRSWNLPGRRTAI